MKFIYINNLYREVFQCPGSLEQLLMEPDVEEAILRIFQNFGKSNAVHREKLLLDVGNGLTSFDKLLLSQGSATIIYSDVIAPENAYEFGRENGIVYYFHTQEKNHLFDPHIHAKYSGEELRIRLKDFSYDGSLKSPAKIKEAINYVRNHLKDIRAEWNRINYDT